jgi:hypothetical protein
MDERAKKTFRLNAKEVKALIGHLEKDMGPNRFSKAIERKLVEEFVEKEWEIKKSPVPGFETNLEYFLSFIPELYKVTKELTENAEEFASSLAHLLQSYQNKGRTISKKILH